MPSRKDTQIAVSLANELVRESTSLSPEKFKEKLHLFQNYLTQLSFSQTSMPYQIISSLLPKSTTNSNSGLDNGKYFGLSGGFPIRITFSYDHIFLSKFYREKHKTQKGIKVSWRFNEKGRLDTIEGKCLDNSDERIIPILFSEERLPFKDLCWSVRDFHINWIPELEESIPFFKSRPLGENAHYLCSFGHTDLKTLLYNIRRGELKEPHKSYPDQISLTELPKNPKAMNIIEVASKLSPYVRLNLPLVTLRYNN